MDPALLCAKLEERGILGGLPVDGGMTRRMIYPETDPLWTE